MTPADCDHPWHGNPGLLTDCPACGANREGPTPWQHEARESVARIEQLTTELIDLLEQRTKALQRIAEMPDTANIAAIRRIALDALPK